MGVYCFSWQHCFKMFWILHVVVIFYLSMPALFQDVLTIVLVIFSSPTGLRHKFCPGSMKMEACNMVRKSVASQCISKSLFFRLEPKKNIYDFDDCVWTIC